MGVGRSSTSWRGSSLLSDVLDMGIHSDDGTVWVLKSICKTRSEAKMWMLENGFADDFIDMRVRTRWMKKTADIYDGGYEQEYEISDEGVPGAFECWEIT